MSSTDTIFGHPRGVFLLSVVEVWERFSFFGMRAILVLFLVSATTADGFGWDKTSALKLYGYYTALVWFTPVVGGWLADRVFGLRRSVVLGGMIMAAGHFAMAAAGYFPSLMAAVSGWPVDVALRDAGLVLGQLPMSGETRAALLHYLDQQGLDAAGQGSFYDSAVLAYYGTSWSFYLALAMILGGNGLFKSPVATMVGRFYPNPGPDKDAGYTLYYMAVNMGAFAAPLIVGLVGEYYGWHLGFSLAGIGMLLGLGLLLWKQALLAEVGLGATAQTPSQAGPLSNEEWGRLKLLGIFVVCALLFMAAYEQSGGLINLMLFNDTQRALGSFEVPTTWFQSLNPMLVVVGAPLVAWLWTRLARAGFKPNLATKFVIGFIVLASSYLVMIGAALDYNASADGKTAMAWIVVWYLLMTFAELIVFPLYYSALSSMAPKRYGALAMGVGFLAFSVGSLIAAKIGAWVLSRGYFDGFVFLAGFCLVVALVPGAASLNQRFVKQS